MAVTIFVPECFPPTAGAIVYDTRLAAELRSLGHAVRVVPVGGHHPLPDTAAQAAAAALWQQERAREPAATPVIDGFCLYAFTPLADPLRDAGAIAILHHPMSQEPQLTPLERDTFAAMERQLLPRLARIVVPSDGVAGSVGSALKLPPEAFTVVTPGVADAARSPGSDAPPCRLLAVGSLIPRKGHDTVLRALAGLPDLAWQLTICGDDLLDPDHAAALYRLAEAETLVGRVVFAGACAADKMEALWRSADVFVSGSRYEGFGMAVAEAVRRGLPLALTQGSAAPEVIPMEGCVLVEPGDYVQLSKALRRLIFSRSLREELAEAAWQAGRSFASWPDQARRFAGLLCD